MRKILLSYLLISACISSQGWATNLPREVAADNRVKIVNYDPNNVVLLRGSYGYQTQIAFGVDEKVQNVSIGDSLAWQAVPAKNYLFLKPVTNSKTNMTVITNINTYNFQLDSTESKARPTYKLQFIYPEGGYDVQGNSNALGSFDPEKINWRYSFTGTKTLAPVEAFDDGQFTYFKFNQNGMNRLPAVFIVGKDRNETLVNYHMHGNYLVINSIGKQFTLRDGDYVANVYNDFLIGDWYKI